MKIAIAQLNPIVGDIKGNLDKLKKVLIEVGDKCDLVVFSELFLTGYPPRDLLENSEFIKKVQGAIDEVLSASKDYPEVGILFGAPIPVDKTDGKKLYNAAILAYQGKIIGTRQKALLPTYDVFDETRYFEPSPELEVIKFKEEKLGISICEDMWNCPDLCGDSEIYKHDPIEALARKKATVLINLSASPFYSGKGDLRYKLAKVHAKRHNTPFIFVNQVGGNDELIFDGGSISVDGNGEPIAVFPSFKEHIEVVDTESAGSPNLYTVQDKISSVYDALILGVRDYVRKCGFSKAVIGLSGGIDSAVVCALAKEALGKENVLALSMPSPYSSLESTEYARVLAEKLGVSFNTVPITDIYSSYIKTLEQVLGLDEKKEVDITLQNIQARIRGNILMAFSNKKGHLLLTTGNKSELAAGYCTLYGDMAGGLAVISDLPKTMVYELAAHINKDEEVILKEIIDRPPSAELKPDQLDQDSLPPYELLDEALNSYLEGRSIESLKDKGFDPEKLNWVRKAIDSNEYKRRQAPLGLKITTKAFGMGRRMPIAAKYD